MLKLTAGVLIWSVAHFFKSFAPGLRARLIGAIGDKSYRIGMALYILVGLVLIVLGWRAAAPEPIYTPPVWGVHVNNLLMLLAVALLGAKGGRTILAARIRHPMLSGVAVWAVAHLLANGDQRSVVLFGGMLLWAVISQVAINRRDGAWTPPPPAPLKGTIKHAVITLVVFAVLAGGHRFVIGVSPFPG